MVIFKFAYNSLYAVTSIYFYIPIWWYSNYDKDNPRVEIEILLHSNMVIFKWEFINHLIEFCMGLGDFTFQYGDIQIILLNDLLYLTFAFTFQYGDIQIAWVFCRRYSVCSFYIPIWWYSNISMFYYLYCNHFILHSNMVIFK